MEKHAAVAKSVAGLALLGWAAFWFWAFTFAYSDSFFRYNHHSRIPTFLAALLAAILMPISALSLWFRASSSRGVE